MLLANFRCSGHNLMIEKGRHDSVDAQFRYCPVCIKNNVRVIEDEYHFFFECRAYKQLRNVFFKRIWIRSQSLNMFYTIMALNDTESLLKVTNFLKQAFVIRTTFLNTTGNVLNLLLYVSN